MTPQPSTPAPTVMSEEVARFDALGEAWWDPDGPMAPLHRLNPVRIAWARDLIARHFKLEAPVGLPLAGVDLLDVGCGAGLFAEPLASATTATPSDQLLALFGRQPTCQ